MKAARCVGLFAFVGSSYAAPAVVPALYPDQLDECKVGMQCPEGVVDPDRSVRSICVATTAGNQCWDACNTAHAATDYSATNSKGVALMVKQLRTGMRFGSCPGASYTPTCNPGDRCTPAGLTWGRGMCTTITGSGNQCLDMCNEENTLAVFHNTPGKQAGTLAIVQMVRAGRDPAGLTTCPLPTIWVWLWFPLLACCAIGICGGAYFMYNRARMMRRGNKGYREPEPPYVDEAAPYVDYGDQYQQDQGGDYQQEYQGDYQQDAPMEAMEDPMPVVDQGIYEPALAPAAAPLSGMEGNLFDQPGMMQPLTMAPQYTQAVPMGTMFPAQPVTMAPTYQSSMMVSGAGYTTAQPQYASSMMVAPMGTQLPSYGAYGAYGGAAPMTTTSMRIG